MLGSPSAWLDRQVSSDSEIREYEAAFRRARLPNLLSQAKWS